VAAAPVTCTAGWYLRNRPELACFGMNRVWGVTAVSVDGAPAGWLGSDGVRTFLL